MVWILVSVCGFFLVCFCFVCLFVAFLPAFGVTIYTIFILNFDLTVRKLALLLQDPKYQMLDCTYSSSTALLH